MQRYFPYLLLIVFACKTPTQAQEILEGPRSEMLARVAFKQIAGGIVLLKATINEEADSLNFILDSGSSGISLDSAVVAHYKLAAIPSDIKVKGIAGSKNVSFVNNQTLTINNLKIENLNFHVNDYSFLTAIYGAKIDGIIGYTVFSRYIIKINYNNMMIDFCSIGSIKYPKGGTFLSPIIAKLPYHKASVTEGKESITSVFLVDIGADLSLMVSKEFADNDINWKRNKKYFSKAGEGIGGKILMQATTIKTLKLGPYKFKNVPTLIFDDENNIIPYPSIGGLLGNDIFRRFNAIFNYSARIIHLTPNSHFADPFDYSYIGADIYFIDNQILFGPVLAGAPADKAGILEGDIIMSIENNNSQNLQLYKSMLQSIGTDLKILINRKGQLLTKRLKPVSIK